MTRFKKLGVAIICILQMVSCSPIRQMSETKEFVYSDTYLMHITVFPKEKGKVLMMEGVGLKKDLDFLNTKNIDAFFISFYTEFAYSPLIIDLETNYKDFVNCFGFDISWYKKYFLNDLTDKVVSKQTVQLEDGFNVSVEIYRLLNDIEVKYVKDGFHSCIYDISLEMELEKKKQIVKSIALFLDNNGESID